MSESKVFMFPDNTTSGSIDPALLMALNNNGGFGGNGNWMWIIFLFFLYPLMRNGGFWGNNGGGTDSNILGTGYLSNLIMNGSGRDLLMQAINGNGESVKHLGTMLGADINAVQSAISSLMSSVQQVGNQVGMSAMQTINAVQAGDTNLGQQIANCCCENRLAIANQTSALLKSVCDLGFSQERGFANTNYQLATQTCDLKTSIKEVAADTTTAIIAKLNDIQTSALTDKIDALREQKTALLNLISQEHQNAYTAQVVSQAVAPINASLSGLQSEVNDIKCKLPSTVTLPQNNTIAVPTCVAAQYGLFGQGLYSGSLWG